MDTRSPVVIVAAPSREEADRIRQELPAEIGTTLVCTDPAQPPDEFGAGAAAVVLGYPDLEEAVRHYADMLQASGAREPMRHRVILLCEAGAAERARELCVSGVFWPEPIDRLRLGVMLMQACRECELRRIGAARAPFVLVVEDDGFQRKLIRSNLEDPQLRVMTVSSGMAAIATAIRLRPDLVLMDIDLPDMSGLEVTQRLKRIPALAQVPVVMVTGNSNRQVVVASLEAGAVDFIVKPLVRDRLIAKVRQRMAKPRGAATEPVAIQAAAVAAAVAPAPSPAST